MSTVTLRIQVDKSGASENIGAVKRDLQGMGETGSQAGAQASQGVNGLSNALNGAKAAVASFLAVYAGIQALSGIVRLSDEYQGLNDRLRLATSSSAEFETAQRGIYAIAQQTGGALGAVNDLYVGLSRSTEQLGLNQGQLLTITAAINQSFAVSGTNAASAEAATRQLGQAFASGVLRGDEFNSMMENAPGLASALATALGVTSGELRKMAADGKLTSDVLASGLLQQAPAIAAQFDQMGLTVGRAFTQLSNATLRFVGEASQASGAGAALAAVISGIAGALPAVVAGMVALAAGYGAVTAAAAVANPAIGYTGTLLAGLASAVGVVVLAYSAFKLGEYLANEFVAVRAAGAALVVGLNGAWENLRSGAVTAFVAVRVAWFTVVDQIQERVADLIQAFINLSQIELPFGLRADFAYGQAEALGTLVTSLRTATDATVENDAAMGILKAQYDESKRKTDEFAIGMFDAVDAHFASKGATEANAAATNSLKPALAAATGETAKLTTAQRDAAKAATSLIEEQERLTAKMGGPAVAAAIELAQRLRAVDDQETALRGTHQLSREEIGRLNTVRGQLIASYQAQVAATQALSNPYRDYIAQLAEERRQLGLSAAERTRYEAGVRATNVVMEYANRVRNEGRPLMLEEIANLINMRKALDDQTVAAQQSAQEAEEWARYWQGASGAVVGAFTDLFSGGIDSLEEFGQQMIRISQRIVGDIIDEFARTGQIRLPTGSDGTGRGNLLAGIQGLGLAYGGYQNAQQGGNPLATVGSFALAGAQIGSIFPVIGTAIGAAIGAVVGGLVELFSGDKTPLLRVRSNQFNGPRQAEGTAQSALGSIFIRTENTPNGEGTSPEIAQRIAEFDNLIASVLGPDQLAAVRAALANVNDTFEDGAFSVENALNSRFGSIVGALSDNIQNFVGTAGTLEQRLGRLFDGVAIEAISNVANGVSQDFGELATLLTRFRFSGEGLGETFLRLVRGASLIDNTLLMLGGTFNGTRLQAATFAGELIALAGGLDEFSAVLNGALEALFSETERNQFTADQAQRALNEALTGLNITGVGTDQIREQLRTQLRAAMEAGNVELTNQILNAANLLGVFSNALEALGEDAVAAAAGLTLGGSQAIRGGGLTSPNGVSPGVTPQATQLDAARASAASLERHTGLLQEIATNTRPRDTTETAASNKAARDGSDAARSSAATLARIEALISQAVRNGVQAGLKTTLGANGRKAATA